MNMADSTRRIFVIHPFLFAIYSVLGVYSQNAGQVPVNWIARSLVFLVLVTIVVYIFLQRIFKDHQHAGFVSTIFLNWIFMGHLYRFLLEQSPFWRTPLGGFCAFLLITVPLGFLASSWVWKRLSNPGMITTFLNIVSLVLVIYPSWITIAVLYKGNSQIRIVREQQAQVEVPLTNPSEPFPDIYMIILDGYGRNDSLQAIYSYDNTQFIEFLEEKGFYVADRATSNYPQTHLTLSSMLNLQYLDTYTQEFGNSNDRSGLYELTWHPTIRRLLKDQGYKFVALPSATLATQIRDADIYFNMTNSDINEFETLLLSSTVVGVTVEAWGFDQPVQGYELHRKYILFSLEKLSEVAEVPGPKFVFAHIMLPHPPFIFNHAGNFIVPNHPYVMWDASLFPGTTEEYQQGYKEQVTFLNQKMEIIISDILARSENPPIIILQGDHGPGAFYDVLELDNNSCLSERFTILDAYYFPDGDYQLLYPSITPVNSFRVVLNKYFGAQLDLLEDRSYYSSWSSPYIYTDVTDQVNLPCKTSKSDAR
ncbi:MAG TPA: hypothetical protein VFQ13_12700 [Anaerolineales bacterium]|nr:hypothetical protein [Anaerolineales bacterium]